MGRRQPKKLGAGGWTYLAGLLHVFVYTCNKRGTPKNRFTYRTLCRCRMKTKYKKIANEKNRV